MNFNVKVLVAGLIKNGGKELPERILKLNEIFSIFTEVEWLVIESDSDDQTLENLIKLNKSKNINLNFESLGMLSPTIPIRTERIAYCRNQYVKKFKNDFKFKDFDYLIVCDLDGVNDDLTSEALLSCFKRNDWDACFANQVHAYYDIWALRAVNWCTNDCWKEAEFLIKMGINSSFANIFSIYSKMIEIPKGNEWIPVQSAFGGLGIYKAEKIKNFEYLGIDSDGKEICEHISFNFSIANNGGKLFINPALINCGLNEHTENKFNLLKTFRN